MSHRNVGLLIAGLLLAAGVLAALLPVHVQGVTCGSALSADNTSVVVGQYGADLSGSGADIAAGCDSRRGSQGVVAAVLVAAGLLGGIVALQQTSDRRKDQVRAV